LEINQEHLMSRECRRPECSGLVDGHVAAFLLVLPAWPFKPNSIVFSMAYARRRACFQRIFVYTSCIDGDDLAAGVVLFGSATVMGKNSGQ
jgi:hypothetical protein